MALSPGTRLGPYEVLAPIGAGGMGEVYRAHDARLSRDVAVKILPVGFSTDPERLRRFEQEARAVGALSHPNILAVYDTGTHDGAPYIVMELLEGETLRERMLTHASSPRALPVRVAVDYAAQIAHGLAAAHGKGIVHRDLKPENVFVTADGRVKILDFGLARLVQPADISDSMATLDGGTGAGTVLGTVGYMSPEQVRGRVADHRADLFAFGAILYEMISGHRAFEGASSADTMSAILNDDPPEQPLAQIQAPAGLVRVIDRCLNKRPEARFQSAQDLAFALEALSSPSSVRAGAPLAGGRRRWLHATLGAAALILAAASAAALGWFRPPRESLGVIRFQMTPPNHLVYNQTAIANFIAISPDGRRIAYSATDKGGMPSLWVRDLDSDQARVVPGSEDGRQPFWSPDGRFLAFFAMGSLRRVSVDGGTAQVLGPATNIANGGTWSREGVILFSSILGPILRVPAAGGETRPVTVFDQARGDRQHSFPHFLPDGRRFLFYLRNTNPELDGIYVKSLDSDDARLVLRASSNVVYDSGYLLYARNSVLLAHAFDVRSAEVTGEPVPVADQVTQFSESGVTTFSSSNGVLAIHGSRELPLSRLRWLDRRGGEIGQVGEPRPYRNPRLSPDGTRIAVELVDQTGNRDIWLMDVGRGVPVRFTFDAGRDASPVWSPDGGRIAWQGNSATYVKPASGAGREEILREEPWIPDDWPPEGLLLHPSAPTQVWLLPSRGDRTPRAVIDGRSTTTHARVAPGGQWVAFANTDSGRFEVYLQNFPAATGRWQISTEGGIQPKWRADGKELYYLGLDGRLMAVPLSLGALPEIDPKPQPLFQTGLDGTTGVVWHQYDVTPDGQRFLVNRPETVTTPLSVIVNWPELIKK